MQTFNIDISRKNGPLVLYAKQGDSLSRFFKIAFFQDGAPWEPPAGALFSVRFGAPGMPSGWYDTIKEPDGGTHSAFSLKDNVLTVELAYEAVSKAGTNTLAVLVLDANGYQLGAWNLHLDVELTPGENSPEADVYYSLLSEQVAQVLQAKDDAQASAILSQSWAVGGTGSRAGEDTNNSKYWSDEAKKSAQESLGFRTFFSAVRPDLNGDLDPSSPMFAGTGATVTVRSAANRIENVTSHGFTEQSGTGDPSPTNVRPITVGGEKRVEVELNGSESGWRVAGKGANMIFVCDNTLTHNTGTPTTILSSRYKYASIQGSNTLQGISGYDAALYIRDSKFDGVESFKEHLKENPLKIWYTPADESHATGIYTPQISEGESYHCNCIKLQAHLCEGDKVDSNVPSGCDRVMIFDGSDDEGITQDGTITGAFRVIIPVPNIVPSSKGGRAYTNYLRLVQDYNGAYEHFYASDTGSKIFAIFMEDSLDAVKLRLKNKPLVLYYRSTEYTAKNDEKACVERHGKNFYTFTGEETVTVVSAESGLIRMTLPFAPQSYKQFTCTEFKYLSITTAGGAYADNSQLYINPTGGQFASLGITAENAVAEWKAYLKGKYDAGKPVQIAYPLGIPTIYAQPAVDLPAYPITTVTQATLEKTAADTPTLLAEKGETGTYTVSGEKNISLYIKSLIKDGDAATLGGKTLSEITQPLTLQLNGTTNQTYDGSTAKTFNVTPTAIGALPADQPAVSAPKSSKPTFAVNYGRIVSPDNSSLYLRNADSEGSGVFIGVREGFQTLSPDMNTSGTPVNLGGPSYRWRTLYLQNQPDVSSDGNLKEKVAPLSEKQMLFFDSLNPVQYKLKGDSHDRLHYGFIAQEVEQAMAATGISDMEFGGFCKDNKIKTVKKYSEQGELLGETEEPVEGYEYSLRYGEFIALNTAAIQALKKEVIELKAQMDKLKGV